METAIVLIWLPNSTDDTETLLPLTGEDDGRLIDVFTCGIGEVEGKGDGNMEMIGRAVNVGV